MHRFELEHEFNMRIKHNFRVYILILSMKINWKEDDILESIYLLNGYRCHKTVKYNQFTSHIIVKFQQEHLAKEAIEVLNKMGCGLATIPVDVMLRNWFIYEMKVNFSPTCAVTIVDIVGNPPCSMNFLTNNLLDSILQDFGRPGILPYTSSLPTPHMQVVFGSMTEALAACMAFGEWYLKENYIDSFFYRVRINPSKKEEYLIIKSGGNPKEAFKLDYFIDITHETADAGKNVPFNNQTIPSRISQDIPRASVNKSAQNINNSQSINSIVPPFCYIPVITSLNTFPGVLMPTNSKLGTNFTNTVQRSLPNRTEVTAKDSVESSQKSSNDPDKFSAKSRNHAVAMPAKRTASSKIRNGVKSKVFERRR